MPVTVRPSEHQAREWTAKPMTSDLTLLQQSCSSEFGRGASSKCKRVIQSSFKDFANTNICPSSNGFVRAAFAAYSQHHHLAIRPEDVWFSILSQLSFYINAHAEELRSSFVAHEGQKELIVWDIGTIQSVDLGKLAVQMTHEMHKQLVDTDLREWIMPNFTTTTATDTIVAAIIMMGSMQKYFSYRMNLRCGIPSVTLLGERADWVELRRRVERLARFGEEPEHFSLLLTPILDYFIRSFDSPEDAEVIAFWSKIVHHHAGGSGPSYLSGWITAFCFWDGQGKRIQHVPRPSRRGRDDNEQGCEVDGTTYHRIDTKDIPNGYVSVPVTVDDNGTEIKTRMVAGSVGIAVSSSGEKLDISNRRQLRVQEESEGSQLKKVVPDPGDVTGLDSLQPVSGWWMYELED
jgi:hypothetical protein